MNKHEVVVIEENSGRELRRIHAEEAPVPINAPSRADPWLVRVKTGDLYAAFFNTEAHLFCSSDKGQTWTDVGQMHFDPVRPDVRISTGLSVSEISRLTVLSDGAFLITYNIGKIGESPLRWLHSDLYVARSDDCGRTWSTSVKLERPAPYTISGGESAGKMVELPDGTVLLPACLFTGTSEAMHALFIYRSSDGGRTWPEKQFVCFFGSETSLTRLASGQLIAAVRYQRTALPCDGPEKTGLVYKHVYLAGSEDGGKTWKNWRPGTNLLGDTPGEVIQLSDGRIVLLYLHRYPLTECNIRARVSHDGGYTWEPYIYLVSQGVGYPASVVLEDDTILTVCGNSVLNKDLSPENGQYTAHVVRWRLD